MQSYSKKFLNLKISTSKGRLFKEKKSSLRTPFQRDRDRIIHSASFRRLKHKTQVFVNTDGDHFRTRLTHSMEVSQISRTIARALNLNEDLCETLSLAHDMGHTPFGHSGADILNECMEDCGGFDHNIQTLRIVTVLEEKYYNFKGLNLTIETLEGLIKHNGPLYETGGFNKILQLNTFKNKINFNKFPKRLTFSLMPEIPPMNVSNPYPESEGHPHKFDFTRLGVRVPAIVISPWLAKGVDSR